jgi:aspartate carbamoyltransferase catalytic subunit
MKGGDIVSIKELSKKEIIEILKRAEEMKRSHPGPLLEGHLMASCFFEPSTRTRLSFEAAMRRLGGNVMGFSEPTALATQKGESLYDSMKIIGLYCDIIVMRHPLEGSARQAALATEKPVINAGDGANEHPTQTLVDLFTIRECQQQRLEGLNIALVGDLLYGRTAHSLALALRLFSSRLYFVSPPSLAMPDTICQSLKQEGIPFSLHQSIDEIIDKVDILYMTRVQKERFAHQEEYLKVKDHFILTPQMLERGQKHLKVLHPLPRVNEIEKSVDETPYAYYFPQAENGIYVRQALLAMLLGK